MIALKLFRLHTSSFLCSQKVFSKAIGSYCIRFLRSPSCNKRFLSSSAILCHEKPVILSASEIIQNDSISSLSNAADALTEPSFAELGLAQTWWPSHIIESCFESIYNYTGAPWWVSIALGTFALRLITSPLFVYSRKAMIRYTNHAPTVMKLRDEMVEASMTKHLGNRLQTRKRYITYVKKHKASPTRLMFSNFTMPIVFISCLRALNEMTSLPVPSMAASSFYWINSLLEPDPYRVLPFLSGCMVAINMFVVLRLNPALKMNKIAIGALSTIPVIAMPLFFGNWSSAFCVYLFVNSTFTSALSMALASKKIQTLLDMPISTRASGKQGLLMQTVSQSRDRTMRKYEAREIRKTIKEQAKQRKKELKGKPPRLFEIGTEARLKEPFVPDFQRDWRPRKVNIYDQ